MAVRQLADATDALHRPFILDFTAQRVARIGWVDNNATFTDDFHSLINQTWLWVIRMDIEKLTHISLSSICCGCSQSCQTGSTPAGNQSLRPSSIHAQG
ncbi:Uncharacterised protein [Enterobacter cloacae]|nr:Uncharacterised protein [Enterobacter cloacae]